MFIRNRMFVPRLSGYVDGSGRLRLGRGGNSVLPGRLRDHFEVRGR